MSAVEAATATASAVEVRSLTKRYGDRDVLRRVTFDVPKGTVCGLLGPNGAGKSTLLETLAGLRAPTSGDVRVLGLDPRRERKALTELVSVQPQSASVFGSLTVRETLRLYASFHSAPRSVRAVIEETGLSAQSEIQARNLSGGQLRRLLLGVAIIGNPRLVILDEPSAGLDPEARQQLLALVRDLKASGTTVLFSTHDMVEATQVCDRVIILAAGEIQADGSPSDLLSNAHGTSTVTFEVPTEEAMRQAESLIDTSVTWTQVGSGFRGVVETTEPDAALELLTAARGLRGRNYRVASVSLEDFYLAIVKEARLRDEKENVHV